MALGALSVASEGTSLSFSLESPPAGKVVKAKACSKLWEVALSLGTSVALSEEVSFGALGSLTYSC